MLDTDILKAIELLFGSRINNGSVTILGNIELIIGADTLDNQLNDLMSKDSTIDDHSKQFISEIYDVIYTERLVDGGTI